ncbi:MAG: CapA family protein [Phycisphaerae bacterium]
MDRNIHTVKLAAVGDLLFCRDGRARCWDRLFDRAKPLWDGSDILFGNLECCLASDQTVTTEPRVVATEQMVRSIGGAFDIVSLGNNHAMDCLEQGLDRLIETVENLDIEHIGAGMEASAAAEATILRRCGRSVAFIAAVDAETGPWCFADAGRAGVAPLDESLVGRIQSLREQVDHVVVSLHWGRERYPMPLPSQRRLARRLIESGADLILGHHPHVLQGMERIGRGAVIYSMGNFVSCEVPFTDGDRIKWNRRERTGCVVLAELGEGGVASIRRVATIDDGDGPRPLSAKRSSRLFERLDRLAAVDASRGCLRRQHLRLHLLKPALGYLKPSKLRTLRIGQFSKALRTLLARK